MNPTNDDFVNSVLEELGQPEPFSPMACYNADGDCVEFYLSNEPHFAKRLDGWVTVFYSEKTGEVVGGFVKGVQGNLLRRFPGLKLYIEGNEVDVTVLLRGPALEADDEMRQKTYKAILDKIEEHPIKAELQLV